MDRLPPELHVKIGRYLWFKDLYQLVLVSKFCHSIFTPELYREIQFRGVYRLWEPNFHMDEDTSSARCLPYAIIENPGLAGFVRSLQLVPFINPALRNPWFALLLLQLKYLQHLYVFLQCDEHGHGQKGPAPTPHFDEVISWAANPESGIFTRLTHLTLDESQARFDYKPPGISVIRLIPFLEISSLRHIRVTRIADQNEQALPRKFNSKVTRLDVKQCDKTFTQLPQLLMGCSELESFTWTLEESTHHLFRRPHRPGFHWEPNRAYDAIYQLRFTLRHLSIKSHICRGDLYLHHDVEYPQPAYFGSLCDFPVLETLQMRMVNLLPFQPGTRVPTSPLWKILPSSLRFLSIDGCLMQTSNMLCDELEDLAAHCQTHLPQLEKVHIAYSHYEKINGQQCLACEGPGSVMSYKEVKADPAIVARLRALGVKFNKQGVRLRPFV
ncbi:uncharacterized protein BO87DRAFT_390261 [Aspergillus neoniger CBS 115656]|uniref:F-box domain-containing protein n=1 Tax=Aspergillus neoniger (strain CBS 115656) TaxID=1448310 RepID=A0A318YD49_ASPNB|nr:hypothetical protein BO87DRAFT_390261 [Aspergillus neoniger CBS 115656]PYH30303.1 hypothetical protein BO87DRAFT_390261 [Aspergillus neoniger CBS 115656]